MATDRRLEVRRDRAAAQRSRQPPIPTSATCVARGDTTAIFWAWNSCPWLSPEYSKYRGCAPSVRNASTSFAIGRLLGASLGWTSGVHLAAYDAVSMMNNITRLQPLQTSKRSGGAGKVRARRAVSSASSRGATWEVSIHQGSRRVYSRLCLTRLVALAHGKELRIMAEREAGE